MSSFDDLMYNVLTILKEERERGGDDEGWLALGEIDRRVCGDDSDITKVGEIYPALLRLEGNEWVERRRVVAPESVMGVRHEWRITRDGTFAHGRGRPSRISRTEWVLRRLRSLLPRPTEA